MQPLHGVRIHVAGDRLAHLIADGHRARVVHATPDACVVTICASLRTACVRPARLSRRRQCESLSVAKVTEENRGSGSI